MRLRRITGHDHTVCVDTTAAICMLHKRSGARWLGDTDQHSLFHLSPPSHALCAHFTQAARELCIVAHSQGASEAWEQHRHRSSVAGSANAYMTLASVHTHLCSPLYLVRRGGMQARVRQLSWLH